MSIPCGLLRTFIVLAIVVIALPVNKALASGDEHIEQVEIIYIDEINKLKQRLLDWADSWSQGDYITYLNYYIKNYTPRGVTHNQWKEKRKRLVNSKKKIRISLLIEDISMNGDADRAETIFIQDYQSDSYSDKVRKKIIWIRQHTDWYIKQEITLND